MLVLLLLLLLLFFIYIFFIHRTIALTPFHEFNMCVCIYLWWPWHDSDRMAVLVMVSKAESIVLYFILYIYILAKIKISFLPTAERIWLVELKVNYRCWLNTLRKTNIPLARHICAFLTGVASRTAASILKRIAPTCEHVSPSLQ